MTIKSTVVKKNLRAQLYFMFILTLCLYLLCYIGGSEIKYPTLTFIVFQKLNNCNFNVVFLIVFNYLYI